MKVLHLIDSGGLYGAEKMLLSLVQEQVKLGLEPLILSAGEPHIDEKPLEIAARKKGLSVKPWRMKAGFNLLECWKILRWAQHNNIDLLHSHGFKFNVLMGSFPKAVRRIPLIATLHGYLHAKTFSKLWLYELLDRLAIRRMEGVVLVGEAMRVELRSSVVKEKACVIRNGLNLRDLQECAISPLEESFRSFFAGHDVVILGVGRLSREKGFDRLIKAFEEIKRKTPSAGLIILGQGEQRDELETLIDQLELKNSVLMPGYSEQVPAVLRTAKVLVMPSLTEGLPITLLEAMALKTPVVASAVGEIPQVLGNGRGGIVLNDISPQSIKEGIERSFEEIEDINKRSEWSFNTVKLQYSSEVMCERYFEFYKSMTEGKALSGQ